MWCCLWMQGVAFLLRRPAIPVPSVLLTATSMCVTCLPPPPPPLSSIFSASSLRPRSCASVRLSDWCAHTLSDHTEPWWLFFFSASANLNGFKINSCCSEEKLSGLTHATGGRRWAGMSHQSAAPAGQKADHTTGLGLYRLYYFFFKTENDRFTTGLFQANPHRKLANTYKTVSKVHHSVNTSSQGSSILFPMIILSSCYIYTNTILYTVETHTPV